MFELDNKLIFTIDLDAFFAQAEELRNPKYKGMPLAVGYELNGRGIISAANYKAREKGIHSGMPFFKARKLCPELKMVNADYEYYQSKANEVFNSISKFSNKIEFVSIDECHVDLTEMTKRYKPIEIAKIIYASVLNETGLTVSIGISTNLLLSKVASNFDKPSGVSTLYKHEIPTKLWPMDVSKLHMVGRKTAEKLTNLGIETIGDLAKLRDEYEKYENIKRELGINLDKHIIAANGESTNIVNSNETKLKSVSRNRTFPVSITDINLLKIEARDIFEYVIFRAMRRKVMPSSINVGLKLDKSFNPNTKTKKLKFPTIDKEVIWPIVNSAIDELFKDGMSVKYCGISFENLKEIDKIYKQLDITESNKDNTKDKMVELVENIGLKNNIEIVTGEKMKNNRHYEKKSPIDRDNIKFKTWDK